LKKTAWTVAAVAAIAVLSVGAFVMPAPEVPAGAVSDGARLAPGAAALRATINPETGAVEISHNAPKSTLDIQTLEALRRDTEGLKPVYHSNGAVSVNLEGRFQSVSVARIGENGKLIVCSEHADEVENALEGDEASPDRDTQTPEVR
jgi:hypothetical protein